MAVCGHLIVVDTEVGEFKSKSKSGWLAGWLAGCMDDWTVAGWVTCELVITPAESCLQIDSSVTRNRSIALCGCTPSVK